MPSKHMWDQAVDEITSWIAGESDWYASAITGNGRAPFAQPTSEKEKRDYYEAQMYNENGTPNETGRQQVLQRIGVQNYVPLLQELEKSRRNQLSSDPPIPAQEDSNIPAPSSPEQSPPQSSAPEPQQGSY